jgi:hypothetical protein
MQSKQIGINPIVIIHAAFTGIKGIPIQPLATEGVKGHIEIFSLEHFVLMNVLN